MADPLSLLREYSINKKPIVEDGEDIIFGDYAWNRNTLTNYRIWGGAGNEGNEFYTLDSLLFFVKHQDDAYHSYVKTAISQGKGPVRLFDKKDLLLYLVHGGPEPRAIDKNVPLDISQRKLVTKRTHTVQESVPLQADLDSSRTSATGGVSAAVDAQSAAKRPRLKTDELETNDSSFSTTAPSATSSLNAVVATSGASASTTAASLAETVNLPAMTEGSSLARVIPADHLQALRAKIQAKRNMANQGGAADGSGLATGDAAGPGRLFNFTTGMDTFGTGADGTGALGKQFTPAGPVDASCMQEILGRERTWRNRVNVLDSQGKDFLDTIVNGILRNVKAKEEGRAGGTSAANGKPATGSGIGDSQHSSRPLSSSGSHVTAAPAMPSAMQRHGYSRYEQEKFNQEEMAGFQIDTMRTYHGQGLSGMMAMGAPATGGAQNQPKSGATAATTGSARDPRTAAQQQSGGGAAANSGALRSVQEARQLSRTQKGRAYRTPIIIIPAAPTSLITMLNAKDILQNLRYVSAEEKKNSGAHRENELLIQRQKADGTTVPYRVVDQPMRLSVEEWDRVVGVFVQGQAWQFKGWPIGQEPSDIFMKVKAFHIRWSRQPLNPNVEKWNVTVINLDERRHLDKASLQQIWDSLDKHIAKTKPHLRY